MEKISWTDHARDEEVLQRGNEERNILPTIKEWTLTELITSCVETAVYNTLLKETRGKDRSDGKTRKTTSTSTEWP